MPTRGRAEAKRMAKVVFCQRAYVKGENRRRNDASDRYKYVAKTAEGSC
jgi:hypothetical protein